MARKLILGIDTGGTHKEGDQEAAILGAELLGRRPSAGARLVVRRILDEFGRRLAQEIISYGFEREGLSVDPREFGAAGLMAGPWGGGRARGHINITVKSDDPVILLGAPVNVPAPFLGKYLEGRLLVLPCFEAAGATGAAASLVYLNRKVEIHALPNFSGYRLFLPEEIIDGESMEDLVQTAHEKMKGHMSALVRLAGAETVEISINRDDRLVSDDPDGILLGTCLSYTVREPSEKR
jgi:hypothetical protein